MIVNFIKFALLGLMATLIRRFLSSYLSSKKTIKKNDDNKDTFETDFNKL